MNEMIGHEEVRKQWQSAMAGTRLHHAWLLTGSKGMGKATFARSAAEELVAELGAPIMPAEVHPDIMVLSRQPASADDEKLSAQGKQFATRRNINVEQVRAMQRRLVTRPTLGSRRVIIIDSIDDLEKSAANALLKSLEEPPSGTFFLLVSHRPGGLLPTIRSRCRVLRFPPLDRADLQQVLSGFDLDADPAMQQAALIAAGGAPGAARAFIDHDLASAHTILARIAVDGDLDLAARGKLIKACGSRPDREKLLALVGVAQSICAEQMRSSQWSLQGAAITAYHALGDLAANIPYANFDGGLAVVEMGGLLAQLAAARKNHHAA
ncbi:AAA family ATPase [Croceicoccus sp. F390]|uniref:AAA family ATPase n=1 Tax=Croceicoccus esteveae TaxID=3075597 RepID=A0ABU2ZJ58_9SPHN|nr:AAA family ATPase [Croceicoccus sp. F390]MDT0576642.1 AAA family ATPase [Croceicoccus sp. F390]